MKNSGKLGLVPASYKGLQHREERRYFDERRPVREEEKIFRFNVKYFIYLTRTTTQLMPRVVGLRAQTNNEHMIMVRYVFLNESS